MPILRYAVLGHPVAHSLSPRIHAEFGRQLSIALDYSAIDADADEFDNALAAFAASGGVGANITLPHKQRAAAACETLSDRARRAGAANTLARGATGWHGDNTDGVGLVRDLTGRHALDLRARRTLLIGAGGAARGVAPALLDAGIGDLFIANRSADRADALADALAQPGRVHPRYLDDLRALGEFDLIVNATSAARDGGLPALPMSLVGKRTAAVDLSYGEVAIPFLAWARAAGAHDAIDGLGMLVEQAAESFALWHGKRPDTDPVYEQLIEHRAALVTAD
ncbi:shikimate dehydrogenase [Luteimonas gilva]|uniref:Shikimate dehydrogenase (NADP(+)) n=1 Tax=Luteimonas gilva TaxID=2572684 RepID=A0A4U5JME0_9GAMM|nr:shikimate dehydrogenase [Luteimonas gilva]TKR30345.1 shikimate dehydrogenase [Luteimonas gilva]